MLLGARETVLRSAYAVLDRGRRDKRRAGVLYLTTERLVFEAPTTRGLVRNYAGGRDVELVVDVPLGELRNVSVRTGRVVRPRLVVDVRQHHDVLDVLEPGAWASAIAEARRHGEPAPAPTAGSAHPPGERTVVKVRCRYCGGLADEAHNRCPSCGAPL